MRYRNFLISAACILPIACNAASDGGWSSSIKAEMVQGCVTALKDSVTAQARQQAGLGPSDQLPTDFRKTMETQYMPEFQKTCACTIDRVAARHSYNDVKKDPNLMKREAEKVGTSDGCPLNI